MHTPAGWHACRPPPASRRARQLALPARRLQLTRPPRCRRLRRGAGCVHAHHNYQHLFWDLPAAGRLVETVRSAHGAARPGCWRLLPAGGRRGGGPSVCARLHPARIHPRAATCPPPLQYYPKYAEMFRSVNSTINKVRLRCRRARQAACLGAGLGAQPGAAGRDRHGPRVHPPQPPCVSLHYRAGQHDPLLHHARDWRRVPGAWPATQAARGLQLLPGRPAPPAELTAAAEPTGPAADLLLRPCGGPRPGSALQALRRPLLALAGHGCHPVCACCVQDMDVECFRSTEPFLGDAHVVLQVGGRSRALPVQGLPQATFTGAPLLAAVQGAAHTEQGPGVAVPWLERPACLELCIGLPLAGHARGRHKRRARLCARAALVGGCH